MLNTDQIKTDENKRSCDADICVFVFCVGSSAKGKYKKVLIALICYIVSV